MMCLSVWLLAGACGTSRVAGADKPQIGKPAPQIEGKDANGKELKLSDYHGKVVVLDFWGDW
jgi:cytochrome oxidase Cu insertion factor (SCO1/SenC/PrrC family)